MNQKDAPTYTFKSEQIFKDIVRFEENKVVLKDIAPKEVAILFYYLEPEDIKIVYEMSNPICKCENKLHKHHIIDWDMDKKYPIHI